MWKKDNMLWYCIMFTVQWSCPFSVSFTRPMGWPLSADARNAPENGSAVFASIQKRVAFFLPLLVVELEQWVGLFREVAWVKVMMKT